MADAADLRFALIQVDAAVVVGHSYGRTVIAEAGHHPAVKKPLYATSYLPQVGQSQGGIMSDDPDLVRVKLGDGGLLELEGEDVSSFGRRFPPRRRCRHPVRSLGPSHDSIHVGFRDSGLVRGLARGGFDVHRVPKRTAVRLSSCSALMLLVRKGSSSLRPATIPSSRVPISSSISSSCFCETRT